MHGVQRVVGQDAHERGIAQLVAAFERLLVEQVRRILDAEGLLTLGVGRVERALAGVRVAAVDVHLLQHDHRLAGLRRGDGRRERGTAGAHDAHVAVLVDGGRGLDARVGLLEGLHVAARLVDALGHSRGEGHGRQRSARDGVEVEALRLEILVLEDIDGSVADVAAFLVLDIDGVDGVVGERDLHVDGAVAALSAGLVRARLVSLSARVAVRVGLRRASGQAEHGQRHGSGAAADELATVHLQARAHVRLDATHGFFHTLAGGYFVRVLDHGSSLVVSASLTVAARPFAQPLPDRDRLTSGKIREGMPAGRSRWVHDAAQTGGATVHGRGVFAGCAMTRTG